MASDPTNQRPAPRRVPVGDRDPDVVADRLLVAGASAVAVTTSSDGAVELVVDLDPRAIEELGLSSRPLGQPAGGPAEHAAGQPAEWVEVACWGPDGERDRVVAVESEVAFGSGTHASTRLCLAALAGVAASAGTVLDVGCGTGVLGLASLAAGAASVRAIDVDPAAVASTTRAAAANGVADRLVVDDTPLGGIDATFDLVLANLLVPIVEELGGLLVDRVGPGGTLVVGGLLLEHRRRAIAALGSPHDDDRRGELELVQSFVEGDWVAIELRRRR